MRKMICARRGCWREHFSAAELERLIKQECDHCGGRLEETEERDEQPDRIQHTDNPDERRLVR
jgi:transcription initiation factor IIE alpha subunit